MPITATTDYIPTIDEFIAHWATADSEIFTTVSFESRAWGQLDLQSLRRASTTRPPPSKPT